MMDKNIIGKFIKLLGDRVGGKWVIVGGSVLPLLHITHRYTEDIDVVGPKSSSQKDTLELMKMAQELGLPIEAINQAASFFLYRIDGWEKELVLVHKGKVGEIYRPNATLFLLLKISRMSETDLADCLEMVKLVKKQKEQLNIKKVTRCLHEQLKKTFDILKTQRLKTLLESLS